MTQALSCPDAKELGRFLLGHLSPDGSRQVESHLSECQVCQATMHSVEANDTLVEAVRARASAGPMPETEAVADLVSRLKEMTPPPARAETEVDVPRDTEKPDLSEILAPPQGPDEIGRLGTYRVLRLLGAGGMGMVFLAEDTQLRRKVALKTMLPAIAQHPQHRERFLREARAAAAIEHPHIVAIFQVGEDNGIPYLAMPFLKGESLEDRLRRSRKLPVAEAVRIADEMAEGLAAAHAEGLIHRDIKPGNVWLENQPARGAVAGVFKVKLLDFGLARSLGDDTHLTQSGAIVGTPAFMAPEQARGLAVDGRADLFSLGCVLYTMLTGDRPFRGDTTMSLLTALALDTPKAPRQIVPGVSAELSDFVMRLLAKQPDQRPASAVAALDELRRLAHTAPEIAKPAVPLPKPTRARPRRIMAIAAGILCAILGAGAWFNGVTIVRIATNKGELVVEVDDPDIEVVVKGGAVEIRREENGKKRVYLVSAGMDGEVEVREPGSETVLVMEKFKVTRAGKVEVLVTAARLAAARKAKDGPRLDPDRKAAEWVLKNSGTVRVLCNGAAIDIGEVSKLPVRPFKLVRVALVHSKGVTEDVLLENMRGLDSLEYLYLYHVDLSDAGLERLASLPNLTNSLTGFHLLFARITDKGLAHLERFRKLADVGLTECQITDAGLKHLRKLPALVSLILNVSGRGLTDSGLRELRGLKLKFLNLASVAITDAGIEHLLGMTTLEHLSLYTSIGDAGLGRLKALPALHSLYVRHTGKVTDEGLKTLADFPHLRTFQISSQHITDQGLTAILKCKHLVQLDLAGTTRVTDAGLEHLKGLKGLVGLDLRDTKVTKAGVQKLAAALPGCTITSDHGTFGPNQTADPDRKAAEWVLSIGGVVRVNGQDRYINAADLPKEAFRLTGVALEGNQKVSDAGLAHFEDCKNLTVLNLNATQVSDAGVAHFKGCKNLTVLGLGGTQVSDAGLAHFKGCKNLTYLALSGPQVSEKGLAHFKDCKNLMQLRLQYTKVSDAGLAHFKECENLRSLVLSGPQVGDVGLAHFKSCKNLTELVLYDTQVSAAGLAHFKDCKNLIHLSLEGPQVSDAGLAHFKDCQNLTNLVLSGPQVSDAGLAHLKGCKNLMNVRLQHTKVSDAGLVHLHGWKNLTSLALHATKVSAAGIEDLKKALPKCKIAWDGEAKGK
jgi:eukaryotic-like serine/threonine-protein kinase